MATGDLCRAMRLSTVNDGQVFLIKPITFQSKLGRLFVFNCTALHMLWCLPIKCSTETLSCEQSLQYFIDNLVISRETRSFILRFLANKQLGGSTRISKLPIKLMFICSQLAATTTERSDCSLKIHIMHSNK